MKSFSTEFGGQRAIRAAALLSAALLFCAVPLSATADNALNLGVSVGRATADIDKGGNTDTFYRVFLRLPSSGVITGEFGYFNLTLPTDTLLPGGNVTTDEVRSQVGYFAPVIQFRAGKNATLYFKYTLLYWSSDLEIVDSGTRYSGSDTGTGSGFGVGVHYRVSPQWNLYVDYEGYRDIGSHTYLTEPGGSRIYNWGYNISTIQLGAAYRF